MTNTPTVWLGGSAATGRSYTDLTAPGTNWFSATGASVLKVYSADLLYAPAAELQQMFAFLKANGIKLAVEAYLVTAGPGQSGEGLASPTDTAAMVARVQALGGTIDYVQMDEALYRGSVVYGMPLSELAANVAANVATIRTAFPAVQIGDIEPFPLADSVSQIQAWLQAYQTATGTPLDSFTPDLAWSSANWRSQLENLSGMLQSHGVGLSVIFHGNSNDGSNAQWGQTADQIMAAVLSDPRIKIQTSIIQTWQAYPTVATPDNVPGAMSNVALTASTLASFYEGGLLGYATSLSFTAPIQLSLPSGSNLFGIAVGIGAVDQEAHSNLAIMITSGSLLLAADQIGSGLVEGSGTTQLLLFGNAADINAELATLRASGVVGSSDQVNVAIFDRTGILADRQISVTVTGGGGASDSATADNLSFPDV